MRTLSSVSPAALVAVLLIGGSAAHASTLLDGQSNSPAPAATSAASDKPAVDIIVTGTRQTGIAAVESAAPIKLVGSEAITHVGQPNLNQVLTQLVPSFRAQSYGGDTANLTLAASLRGLNPNETLVLVNGKRRHSTANLQVLASPTQGGAAPDLDFIAPASIDHVEVLEDGAAAQYGSDAIAGVINIILKHKQGGSLSATGGEYYKGDGETYSGSLNYGWANDRGYLDMTAFYRFHDFSRNGKQDVRTIDPVTGQPVAGLTGALLSDIESIPNFPYSPNVRGDSRSKVGTFAYNTAYDITDWARFYSFGTLGFRNAESQENLRLPNRLVRNESGIGDPGSVSSAVYNADVANNPSLIFSRTGFLPWEAIRESDGSITGGLKGSVGAFNWDLSTTYGEDRANLHVLHSANRNLFLETGTTPTSFYVGRFTASEWTSNFDVTYQVGQLATLAAGAEYRRDTYAIGAGDPTSSYKTGAQSYPGFPQSSAGSHARHDYAIYGDVALSPVEGFKVDGAVRHENYSDFGQTTNWKITGRYDFNPVIAIRGTASTGFRAPTLPESYYTSINAGAVAASVQLAPNSAAAKFLGVPNLRPEKSTSYSIGAVLRPVPHLIVTIDAYQIGVKDRIVGSGLINTVFPKNDPRDIVWSAINASGYQVENFSNISVATFVNGPSTRTRGVDFVASYDAELGGVGRATFTLSGAYGKTTITRRAADPAQIQAFDSLSGRAQSLYNAQTYSFLTDASPRFKIIGGVNWTLGKLGVTVRETFYTKAAAILSNTAGVYTSTKIDATGITDLEVRYHITPAITMAAGSNNLLNKFPNSEPYNPKTGTTASGQLVYDAPLGYSPYGINGGYWYGRVTVNF